MVELFLISFGICIGSFLNVVIYRLNHQDSPLRGRSYCPECKHQLSWQDNIPVVSFWKLAGKCRYCHKPISWQYPLVELGTGLLTLVSYRLFMASQQVGGAGYFDLVVCLAIGYVLSAIFVSDLKYGIIPDELVVVGSLVGLGKILSQNQSLIPYLGASLGAGGLFLGLVLITKERGMGWGDVKLAMMLGLVLGWPVTGVAIYLAFLTGAVVGVILILKQKKRFGQTIPFGPFLVSWCYVCLFWGKEISLWIEKLVLH